MGSKRALNCAGPQNSSRQRNSPAQQSTALRSSPRQHEQGKERRPRDGPGGRERSSHPTKNSRGKIMKKQYTKKTCCRNWNYEVLAVGHPGWRNSAALMELFQPGWCCKPEEKTGSQFSGDLSTRSRQRERSSSVCKRDKKEEKVFREERTELEQELRRTAEWLLSKDAFRNLCWCQQSKTKLNEIAEGTASDVGKLQVGKVSFPYAIATVFQIMYPISPDFADIWISISPSNFRIILAEVEPPWKLDKLGSECKHVLESTVIHGVHVEFTPKSTSWAAPQPALKVLLQAFTAPSLSTLPEMCDLLEHTFCIAPVPKHEKQVSLLLRAPKPSDYCMEVVEIQWQQKAAFRLAFQAGRRAATPGLAPKAASSTEQSRQWASVNILFGNKSRVAFVSLVGALDADD
ncbi:hypothetical protein Anapl_13691 [Anas platyrhynchos]|uniref:Uncharacterized protein n=1 Tax=Anas platyrhynchos TaxID=8839 RepID=R0JAG8_ANAPL|nr:hypothetical protein Anapl_13691 [Anas platyrhynchos]